MSVRVPQAPTAAVAVVVAAGLVVAGAGAWRPGCAVVALGLLLAAVLRLVLPPAASGWLVVRSRAFDTALLTCLGLAVLGLALTVPTG